MAPEEGSMAHLVHLLCDHLENGESERTTRCKDFAVLVVKIHVFHCLLDVQKGDTPSVLRQLLRDLRASLRMNKNEKRCRDQMADPFDEMRRSEKIDGRYRQLSQYSRFAICNQISETNATLASLGVMRPTYCEGRQ